MTYPEPIVITLEVFFLVYCFREKNFDECLMLKCFHRITYF